MKNAIRVWSMLTGAIVGLYGGWPPALTILVVMMAIDYLSGLMVAIAGRSPKTHSGGLSSKIGFIGIARKGFIMAIVLVATKLDQAIGNGSMAFQMAATLYYIANEGISVLENANLMGVSIPPVIRDKLETLRDGQAQPEDKRPD